MPIATVNGEGIPYFASTSIGGSVRCLAACIKVHYTGSELSRQGMVGAALSTQPTYELTATGATLTPVTTLQASMPQIDRLGDRVHEYRWFPSMNDTNFNGLSGTSQTPLAVSTPLQEVGNALVVSVANAPAFAVTYEITAVWEYSYTQSLSSGSTLGLVQQVTAPKSANTLNDVARAIGNIGKWALEATMGGPGGFAKSIWTGAKRYGPSLLGMAL